MKPEMRAEEWSEHVWYEVDQMFISRKRGIYRLVSKQSTECAGLSHSGRELSQVSKLSLRPAVGHTGGDRALSQLGPIGAFLMTCPAGLSAACHQGRCSLEIYCVTLKTTL